ncbi:hypothetical protein EMIT048CA2_20347 [Pseudomonas chlororaphis]
MSCKPLILKILKKIHRRLLQDASEALKGLFGACLSLKFPVSIRVCQTNPHIDKVKFI